MRKSGKDRMLGDLIGLARTTDGSKHLINPEATALIRECLTAFGKENSDYEALIDKIDAVKRRMVPNCYACANPCGRTSPFDMGRLQAEKPDVLEKKTRILHALCRLCGVHTVRVDDLEKLMYDGLIVIGMDGISPSVLQSVTEQLENI